MQGKSNPDNYKQNQLSLFSGGWKCDRHVMNRLIKYTINCFRLSDSCVYRLRRKKIISHPSNDTAGLVAWVDIYA